MRFRHILLTMFNRRMGGRGAFPDALELDDDWLRHRWELFTRYTVPSVAAQSESDFTWIILCHPESPAWLRGRARAIDVPSGLHFSFRLQDPVLARLRDDDADALLVTRIDSDDAWHRQAMERIRDDCAADPYTSEIIILTDGYLLDDDARRMRPYHHFSPAFHTKINHAPNLDPLDIGGNHMLVRRRFPARSISDGQPMFVVVSHKEHHRGRACDPADPRWLSTSATAEIMQRDYGVTLTGDGGGKPAARSGSARRSLAGTVRQPPPRPVRQPPPRHVRRAGAPRQRVVVSIPCSGSWDSAARAAESVLDQDHRDLLVIMASDGDASPRWDLLRHVDDPRLIRIEYSVSRGRHFADQVVLMARLGRYLLLQDADGWSEPGRVSALLEQMRRQHAGAAVSAYWRHEPGASGPPAVVSPVLPPAAVTPMYNGGPDHGAEPACPALFDAPSLLNVGGRYGGYRCGYDTFVLHLMRMTGTVTGLDHPLYHHAGQPYSPAPGDAQCPDPAAAELAELHGEAYHVYCEYLQGSVGLPLLGRQLRALAWRHVTASDWDALRDEATRLRWHVHAGWGPPA